MFGLIPLYHDSVGGDKSRGNQLLVFHETDARQRLYEVQRF